MKKLTVLALALTLPFTVNATIYEPDGTEVTVKPIPSNITKYIDEKIHSTLPDRSVTIGVDNTGYAALNDGYTTVSVAIEEIKPHANGSEITLRIVNWMGLTLTDLNFEVAATKPDESIGLYKKASLSEAKPGKAAYLKVRVPKKPNEFTEVGVIYNGADGITYSSGK